VLVGERLRREGGGNGGDGHGVHPLGGRPWAGTVAPRPRLLSVLEGDRVVQADAGAEGDGALGGRLLRAGIGAVAPERVPIGPL